MFCCVVNFYNVSYQYLHRSHNTHSADASHSLYIVLTDLNGFQILG